MVGTDAKQQAATCVEQFCLPSSDGDAVWHEIVEIGESSKRCVLFLGHFSDQIPIHIVKANIKSLYEASLWPTTGAGVHKALRRLDADFLKNVWEPIAVNLDSVAMYQKEQPNKFSTDIDLYEIIGRGKAVQFATDSLASTNSEVKSAAEEYLEDLSREDVDS